MTFFIADTYTKSLQCYLVGGAVRDFLMGSPSEDRDWVVVGSTPEEMLSLGFLPVGEAFTIFLHPISKEEYALARSEKKTGHGYQGFTFYTHPDVTLEEDLLRRDLTINALAMSSSGEVIDPYGGQADLTQGIFRHVSEAFIEDPLRILRLARFHAQFIEFNMAEETLRLGQNICQSGELSYLAKERILTEILKGLSKQKPSRMFTALQDLTALEKLFPTLQSEDLMSLPLDVSFSATARYAIWAMAFREPQHDLHEFLKASKDLSQFANGLRLFTTTVSVGALRLDAEEIVWMLERLGVLRFPERYLEIVHVAQELIPDLDLAFWHQVPKVIEQVPAAEIASQFRAQQGEQIKNAIFKAKVAKVQEMKDRLL